MIKIFFLAETPRIGRRIGEIDQNDRIAAGRDRQAPHANRQNRGAEK